MEEKELPWKCPVCGARFMTEEELKEHVRKERRKKKREEKKEEEAKEEERKIDEIMVKGIHVTRGDCLRVIVARSVYVFRVDDFTDNPTVVRGVDMYGNEIALDLRKAIVITKLTPEKFAFLQERGKRAEARFYSRTRVKKKKKEKKEEEGG